MLIVLLKLVAPIVVVMFGKVAKDVMNFHLSGRSTQFYPHSEEIIVSHSLEGVSSYQIWNKEALAKASRLWTTNALTVNRNL